MFVAKPGIIVGNRYSLTQVIGRGGMGEVWRAHDRELDSACAVKFIVPHLATDRGIRERFSREAKAVARLRSPHVVQILGVGEIDNIPYLAMELLEGETLLARLSRHGRLPPAMTLQVIEQVAEALESAHHAGIVHRDLKPDNVWFWSGSKVFVKVLDFGVAKTGLTTESLQTATGALVGTPQYMSPEQALGNRDVDHRSDLWSLAVITVECLSGKRPFDSAGLGDLLLKIVGAAPPTLQSFAPELPASLQEWWTRALARDPRDRFQSARELAEALRPHLAQLELNVSQRAEPLRSSASLAEDAAVSVRGGASRRSPSTDPGGMVVGPRSAGPLSAAPGAARPASLGLGLGGSVAPAPAGVPPESVAARSLGSVGPTSSSRHPLLRRDNRQRNLILAAALVGVAVLVTAARLFLSRESEPMGPTAPGLPPPVAATVPAALPAPGAPSGQVAPSDAPASPSPQAAPKAGPEVRIAPAEANPWDQALRGGKGGAPETAASALQPQRDPAAAAASPKPSVAIVPAAPAEGAAPAEQPLRPRATPKASLTKPTRAAPEEEPASARSESATPTPPASDGPGESEAARKKRLRDLVGLPKTN